MRDLDLLDQIMGESKQFLMSPPPLDPVAQKLGLFHFKNEKNVYFPFKFHKISRNFQEDGVSFLVN